MVPRQLLQVQDQEAGGEVAEVVVNPSYPGCRLMAAFCCCVVNA